MKSWRKENTGESSASVEQQGFGPPSTWTSTDGPGSQAELFNSSLENKQTPQKKEIFASSSGYLV